MTRGPGSSLSIQHRRVYRSVGTARWAGWLSVATIGFAAVGAIPGPAQIFSGICAIAMAILTWRYWNVGVHVEVDGLKLVRILGSTRVPWNAIDRFEVMPRGIYPYTGHLLRTDGQRPEPVFGLGAPARPESRLDEFRRQVEAPVDELNQVLAARRRLAASSASRAN